MTVKRWFGMIRTFLKRVTPYKQTAGAQIDERSANEVTSLLERWHSSNPDLQAELVSRLYPELKRIAQCRMRSERSDHTLQPTALVNEFFLQLAKQREFLWRSRAHFLAVASTAMKRLLIDYARAHDASKRGGDSVKIQLDGLLLSHFQTTFEPAELNEILDRLEAEEPRMSQIVELRCFGGLTHAEIAETLGIDERTVKRDWQVARAWLFGQLRKGSDRARGGMGAN